MNYLYDNDFISESSTKKLERSCADTLSTENIPMRKRLPRSPSSSAPISPDALTTVSNTPRTSDVARPRLMPNLPVSSTLAHLTAKYICQTMDHRQRPDSMMMVHQWAKPRMSCVCCRDKKRRCDRLQPCSNCKLRSVDCEYPSEGRQNKMARQLKAHERQQHILEPVRNSATASAGNPVQSTS